VGSHQTRPEQTGYLVLNGDDTPAKVTARYDKSCVVLSEAWWVVLVFATQEGS